MRSHCREGPEPVAFTVGVSRSVVSQAGIVVTLEAQIGLLALGSGLAGASVVSWHSEGYDKALSPAPGDLRADACFLEGGTGVYSYTVYCLLCSFLEAQTCKLLNGDSCLNNL